MPAGRPSIYTEELGKEICRRISLGESLRSIEKSDDMPAATTVYYWLLDEDKSDFLKHYERARETQAQHFFEELDELAERAVNDIQGDDRSDNARVSARKLQIDTLKWRLSKMIPKKYGDKVDVTSGNKPLPLLYVLHNEGNKEDIQPQEEN